MPRLFAAVLLLAACAPALALTPLNQVQSLRSQHHSYIRAAQADPQAHFKQWALEHAKSYVEHAQEYAKRFSIWVENLAFVVEYNARKSSHWLHLNKFADLTTEEFTTRHLGYEHALKSKQSRLASSSSEPFLYADVDEATLPQSVDWRKAGAVTQVKNQGMCGSCWAFSTTGAVEGINAIVTKELVSLSEQELVDCDNGQDQGCSGGLMDYAFQWIIDNGGIDTEEDYPYKAQDGSCLLKKKKRKVVSIDGYQDVPENNEVALKKAAAHQPVSVAIEADAKSFQLYGGGVYDDIGCGTSLNHGVLLVGYGVDKAEGTYWVVKNSWGADWGDKGFIRLKMGIEAQEGLCGIAMAASFPIKKGPNPPQPGPDPGPDPGPEPGPDDPVQCDEDNECPSSTTCCCVMPLFGMCFQWGCCPMEGATCCDDNEHCCPADLPVCDVEGGRCLPKKDATAVLLPWKPMLTRTPATRRSRTWSERIFGRGWSKCPRHASTEAVEKPQKQQQ